MNDIIFYLVLLIKVWIRCVMYNLIKEVIIFSIKVKRDGV